MSAVGDEVVFVAPWRSSHEISGSLKMISMSRTSIPR
jgi:hypothetical protein